MKNKTRLTILCGACALLIATTGLRAAAEASPEPRVEKKIRVVRGGDAEGEAGEKRIVRVVRGDGEGAPEKHVRVMKMHDKDMPMEKVTFLGVETGRVSATVAAQLGIPERTGLTILRVIEESPAVGVLEKHDVLTRFNDQILVNEGQLSVLVRSQKAGDEVTLTFLRGGKETKARVKLGERERPKMAWAMEGLPHEIDLDGFQYAFGEAAEEWGEKAKEWAEKAREMSGRVRDDVERTLRVLRSEDGEGDHVFITGDGPMKRVTHINKARGNIILADEAGRAELRMKADGKEFLVKDNAGKVLFEGPVTTDEQRAALSPEVRARLDQVESMIGMEFKLGDNAETKETSILLPEAKGQGVSLERSDSGRALPTYTL